MCQTFMSAEGGTACAPAAGEITTGCTSPRPGAVATPAASDCCTSKERAAASPSACAAPDAADALDTHSLAASLNAVEQQLQLDPPHAITQQQPQLAQPQPQPQPQPAAAQEVAALQPHLAALAAEAGSSATSAGDAERSALQPDESAPALQPQQQQQQQQDDPQGLQQDAVQHATLFFAKVPRSASREQVQQLFAAYGDVVDLNLFVPYEGAPASKGCGLVVMRSAADAAAAIAGLESHTWEGMHSAMVLKLMGSGGNTPVSRPPTRFPGGQRAAGGLHSPMTGGFSAPGPSRAAGMHGGGGMRLAQGRDVPPAGCAPDAYKLFVGNVPRVLTESDLLPVFETIGPVKELVVLRDRETQESKGSAFLWYASGADADKACLQFNMRLLLTTPTGPAPRTLVVRRAAAQKQHGPGLMLPQHSLVGPQHHGYQPAHAHHYISGGELQHTGGIPGAGFMPGGGLQGHADMGLMHVMQPSSGGMPMAAAGAGAGGMRVYDPRLGSPAAHLAAPAYAAAPLWQQGAGAPAVASVSLSVGATPAGDPQYGVPVVMAASSGLSQPYLVVQQGQHLQQQDALPGGYGPQQQQQLLLMAPGGIPTAFTPLMLPGQQQQQPQDYTQAYIVAGGSPTGGSPSLAPDGPSLQQPGPGTSYQGAFPQEQQGGGGAAAQPHCVSLPVSAQQLSQITMQLGSVSAMSGASISTEQNYACGSLALVIRASSQQQLALAWQLVHGMLAGQPGGGVGGGPQPEVPAA